MKKFKHDWLNILMVSTPVTTKGPIPFITELLVLGLEKLGHNVVLISRWGRRHDNENILNKIVQRSIDISYIVKTSRSDDFDLIYIHTSLDTHTLLRDIPLFLALRFLRIPIIALFHGSDIDGLIEHKRSIYFLGTRLLFWLASGVLVYSTEEQSAFKTLWPWSKCEVVTQPMSPIPFHGVNLQNKKGGETPTLLFAGRFIKEKGVLDILNAYTIVRSQIDCQLVMAGDGPLMETLRKMVEERPCIQKSVEFTGYLDRQSLWEIYLRSDVLLLPTYHPEGMPTVLLEAMAYGIGIICTRTRGAADYLQEGENALFIPPKCPEILADRIIELISNPDLLFRMKKANLEMSRYFEPMPVASKHIEVIKSFGFL